MHRRAGLVLLVVPAIAACGSGSKDTATPSSTEHTTTTASGSASTAPTSTALSADLAAAKVRLTKIAEPDTPTAMTVRAGDDTLYVTEQAGSVRAVRNGKLVDEPVLDLTDRTRAADEQGLLGLAFSRDGSTLYVDYTNEHGDTRVDAYAVVGNRADPGSRRELLAIAQPQSNHNGGQVAVGPDGMLYVGTGDGGAANDEGDGHAPGGNGQSLDTLLGKILRIDPRPNGKKPYSIPPDNPFARGGGRPEIWSYGLRNPWRFSFDRETGDLWIGDVGQNRWEEIDFAPGTSSRGANFGWNRLEATHTLRGSAPSGAVSPIFEYPHHNACSVTGGFVYRGRRIPALVGAYVFADYCSGKVSAFVQEQGTAVGARELGVEKPQISSFGQDNDDELYVLSQGAGLFRLDPA